MYSYVESYDMFSNVFDAFFGRQDDDGERAGCSNDKG
jgi:hypothetical protein